LPFTTSVGSEAGHIKVDRAESKKLLFGYFGKSFRKKEKVDTFGGVHDSTEEICESRDILDGLKRPGRERRLGT